ncbi:MAG: flagellar hook assembly protein FlgD [Parvularculaceae bacterium]
MFTPKITDVAGAPAQRTGNSIADAAAASASDFQSFLTLLTAQLRNQDPLSPLDSTQFVEQLASFSAVEQQIETNRRLEEIAGGLTASGLEGASQWIGKEVEAPVDAVFFKGESLNFAPAPSPLGLPSEVIVRDSADRVVYRAPLAPGQSSFEWNGTDNAGFVVPQGGYKVSVAYEKDGAVVATKPPLASARVVEARMINGALGLILENGGVVEPAVLTAVREASRQASI